MQITPEIPLVALAASVYSLSLAEKITLRQMLETEIHENPANISNAHHEDPWMAIFAEDSETMTDISNEAFKNRKSFV